MNIRLLSAIAVACLMTTALSIAAQPTLESEDDKTLYALGLAVSRSLSEFALKPAEVEIVAAGLADGILGNEPKVDLETYGPKLEAYLRGRSAEAAKVEAALAQKFCDKMAAEPGAVKTDSGLVYIETRAGTGASPKPDDTVRLHYHGTLRDGSVFDSSVDRGEPAQFSLKQVVPCFSEGLQKMKVGGKGKLICPADLAYGDRGAPPKIRPGAAIAFDIELLEIVPPAAPASATP